MAGGLSGIMGHWEYLLDGKWVPWDVAYPRSKYREGRNTPGAPLYKERFVRA